MLWSLSICEGIHKTVKKEDKCKIIVNVDRFFHRFLYISHSLWELLLYSHLLDVNNMNSFTGSLPKLQRSPASQQKGALMEYNMLSSCRSFT